MEKFFFASKLLVPMPQSGTYTIFWLGTLKSANNVVDVLAFNTNNLKKDLLPILRKDLANLMQIRRQGSREIGHLKLDNQPVEKSIVRMRNIKKQIRFIRQTMLELDNSAYIKSPDQELLDIVSQKLPTRLTPNDVVYITGVSHIEKC